MNPGIRKLINPIAVDDETYIRIWQNNPYEGLGFSNNDNTEHFTNKGERMWSKSEVAIGNLLLLNEIPYKYECPVIRKNGEKLYPDFTILDVIRRRVIYWEHLGINLYITFESSAAPMGTNEPLKIINEILQR